MTINTMQPFYLHGRVAIVTGAGSCMSGEVGTGRASAIVLARLGAKVVLLDYNISAAEETLQSIKNEGGTAIVVQCDVSNEDSCRRAVEDAVANFGAVHILVNNVGLGGPPGDALDVDMKAWDRDFRVNVNGMLLMSRYVIPEMTKLGGGSIINMGSIAGLRGGNPTVFYPTSKGAVIQMTRVMAQHHGKDQIRVNCVCPGAIMSPMVGGSQMPEAQRMARANDNLLKKEGTAWDIANAVGFLASDAARWMTGVILPVDGGAMAGIPGKEAVEGALPHMG